MGLLLFINYYTARTMLKTKRSWEYLPFFANLWWTGLHFERRRENACFEVVDWKRRLLEKWGFPMTHAQTRKIIQWRRRRVQKSLCVRSLIRRMTRNDKNAQINRICEEIQENAHANKPRDLFRHVKHLTAKRVPKSEVVKDANGQILTESDDIKRRWKEYCEQLFKKDGHVTSTPLTFSDYEDEPDVRKVEECCKKDEEQQISGHRRNPCRTHQGNRWTWSAHFA